MLIHKLLRSGFAGLILAFAIPFAFAQPTTRSDIRPLVLGQPIERELKGDEAHSYSLALQAGQFLDLVVEQKGIDVVVTLFDPNNKKLAEVDSPNGDVGPEPLSMVIKTTGNYRLEVRSLEKTAPAGRYEANIGELRAATEKDKNKIAAHNVFAEGEALRSQGNGESLRGAIKKYEEALLLYRAVGDKSGESDALHNLGSVYDDLGEKQKALEYYNQSLPLRRAVGNKHGEATTLNDIGLVYYHLGENEQALTFYNESLPLHRAVGDKGNEAITLDNIGHVYSDLGKNAQALKFYNESLPLGRSVGDKRGEARTLNNIGLVYDHLGEKDQALKFYNESLPLDRVVGDKGAEAITLDNIGHVYSDLGKNAQALKFYNESLPLRRAVGDKRGEARTLNNIGLVYSDLGENEQALKFYNESLPLHRAVSDKGEEAITLHNIGAVYSDLGENEQALKFYNESLPLSRAVYDKGGEAVTLNSIGHVYSDLGKNAQALKYYNESLPLGRAVGDKRGEATTLNNIGVVYSNLGEKQQALKVFNESLPLFRAIGDPRGEAVSLNNIGNLHRDLGENEMALKFYYESLPLSRAAGDKRGEARALQSLFSILASGNPRFGVFYGKQSVNDLQILRSNVRGLNKNIQQTFLKSIEYNYRRLADALLAQNRLAEAQQSFNLFKDQQYFDLSSNKQTAPIALTARETTMAMSFDQKLEVVVAAIRRLDDFKRGINKRQPTEPEAGQIKQLEAGLQKANDDYLAFLKKAEAEFAAPPDEKDKIPDIADVREMQTILRETSAVTKQATVAVYTLVGEDYYRALIITPDDISSIAVPIKVADLNKRAQELWSLLRSPKYDPRPAANDLYKTVFAPIEAKLPKDTKTILWSLDGNLRYVPMAALYDGKKYLVERYENVIFTRADGERMTRQMNPAVTGTGMGSSEAHTVNLQGDQFDAAPLPAVKTELNRIFKKDNVKGVLLGGVLLDGQFTKPAMLNELKERRPLVHIASHFRFEPGDEARSFLLLGDGTPFTLDEMKQQSDLFSGVDLLTLSACSTAAQRPDANGREVDGFAELAQRLGAGAVMASLWEVSDVSTAELMTRFYQDYRGRSGDNKAEALRNSQLALLKGKYKAVSALDSRQLIHADSGSIKIDTSKLKLYQNNKNAPFAHPFYWSPFILIGNWK